MRRRVLLATAAGGLAALAGCLDAVPASTDDPSGDRSSTDGSPPTGGSTPADDPTPTDGSTPTDARSRSPSADVTVERVRLQYGVVTPTSPDSIGISDSRVPYLVARVRVDGPLARDDFALAVGDDRYGPATVDRLYRTAWGDDRRYGQSHDGGLLLFEPPSRAPAGDLRLTWPGGERPIDGAIRDRLGRGPPALSAALDVPTTHAGGEAPPVGIEVTNEEETPARFLGALNRIGPRVAHAPVARVTELLPAGERVRVEVADGWAGRPGDERVGDDDPDVVYRLDYAGGGDSARIRLVEGG